MAITGHKNQQSLTDYDELDEEDHLRLSRVLNNEKPSTSKHATTLRSVPDNQPKTKFLTARTSLSKSTLMFQFSTSITQRLSLEHSLQLTSRSTFSSARIDLLVRECTSKTQTRTVTNDYYKPLIYFTITLRQYAGIIITYYYYISL